MAPSDGSLGASAFTDLGGTETNSSEPCSRGQVKPCKKCGSTERYPSGGCKECDRRSRPARNERERRRRAGGVLVPRAQCEACGRQNREGVTCKPKSTSPRPVTRPCAHCKGPKPVGYSHRQTCSDACAEARSKETAAKLRKPGRIYKPNDNGYTRKDKQAWIDRLTAAQGGRCAVCDELKPLVLDHDHVLGEPRAMLCVPCNAALGLMYESPAKIASLFRYASHCQTWRAAFPTGHKRPRVQAGPNVCNVCGGTGHNTRTCTKRI